eukprot:NODE_10340_length_523_cov_4.345000_g9692_i0.p1 GENE.NODE_10340_length_523_cov_4.345000_g9692_i0~~NODE_10340_length_523_cov_4.345000_g9692_i0.p1  ORF type:complete len:147 (-),score=21.87 NODE_10340_length_523_cov_4.345000_g9692_i0:83-484(-)
MEMIEETIGSSPEISQAEYQNIQNMIYSCKKCRRTLFYTEDIKLHDDYDSAPKYFAKGHYHQEPPDTTCSSYFLNEETNLGEFTDLEGRIYCPNAKCKQVLGSYNWSGLPCSCGRWVTPAFQLTKSRVDEFPK